MIKQSPLFWKDSFPSSIKAFPCNGYKSKRQLMQKFTKSNVFLSPEFLLFEASLEYFLIHIGEEMKDCGKMEHPITKFASHFFLISVEINGLGSNM